MLQALDELDQQLRKAGSSLHGCVKLNVYAARSAMRAEAHQAIARTFPAGSLPAVTFVVTALPDASAAVAVDAVAILNQAGPHDRVAFPTPMTSLLPAGGVAYISGQAEKGEDLRQSTARTMAGLGKTLSFLGAGWNDVVHVKAFLQPMSSQAVARQEIAKSFSEGSVPPIVLVEWISSGLPIEIEMVVALPKLAAPAEVEYLTPPDMKASPIYSRVARFSGRPKIYTSGFSVAGEAAGQVHGLFAQLQEVLQAAGSDRLHLVKATYYVAAEDVSKALNEFRPQYYDPARPPAASKAMVQAVSEASSTRMTIDWIAVPK